MIHLRYAIAFCALAALTASAPVSAQSAAENVAKAQQTLTRIERLIAGIQARHAEGASQAAVPARAGWQILSDGSSLDGWKQTDFEGGGKVHVDKSFRGGPPAIVVEPGITLSGFNWTRDVPNTNYEISLEAMKIEGGDFMCGLTFPVGDSHASLILGGWGGTVAGISSIDGHDASENETSSFINFPKDRWYTIRMRVTPKRLEAWVDAKKIVDQDITDRKISLRRGEIAKSIPLGLSTFQTSAAYRTIKLRRLDR